jgi:hypothetical protein
MAEEVQAKTCFGRIPSEVGLVSFRPPCKIQDLIARGSTVVATFTVYQMTHLKLSQVMQHAVALTSTDDKGTFDSQILTVLATVWHLPRVWKGSAGDSFPNRCAAPGPISGVLETSIMDRLPGHTTALLYTRVYPAST